MCCSAAQLQNNEFSQESKDRILQGASSRTHLLMPFMNNKEAALSQLLAHKPRLTKVPVNVQVLLAKHTQGDQRDEKQGFADAAVCLAEDLC
jgi:hypothetical protein